MKLTRQQYIDSIADAAIKSTQGTKLFPSVLIAQAILESGDGNSSLSRPPHNNHFGIKATSSWKGARVYKSTREYLNGKWVVVNEPFRAYPNTVASLKDRNKLFNLNRYKKVHEATTPEEQAKAIHDAGYATAPTYASSLVSLIERYNLKKYDQKKSVVTCPHCLQLLELSVVS